MREAAIGKKGQRYKYTNDLTSNGLLIQMDYFVGNVLQVKNERDGVRDNEGTASLTFHHFALQYFP